MVCGPVSNCAGRVGVDGNMRKCSDPASHRTRRVGIGEGSHTLDASLHIFRGDSGLCAAYPSSCPRFLFTPPLSSSPASSRLFFTSQSISFFLSSRQVTSPKCFFHSCSACGRHAYERSLTLRPLSSSIKVSWSMSSSSKSCWHSELSGEA